MHTLCWYGEDVFSFVQNVSYKHIEIMIHQPCMILSCMSYLEPLTVMFW